MRNEGEKTSPLKHTSVLGACPHDCPDTCSLHTTVQDGVATKVEGNPAHPATDGVLCTKVSRYTERVYHPERLLSPLKRVGNKGEGRFEPVTWDSAIADIAQRLSAIAARNPEAILPYSYAGTMGQVQGEAMAQRFFHRLGAAQLHRSICASAGGEALAHTLGSKTGMAVAAFAHSKLILIWGSNPITSSVHFWRHAQAAKRAGAKLICIDPRRSDSADKCHQHLALLPGTDAALALALMHELIVHDWLDHDYIAQHTLGFAALKERALAWPPQRAAAVCGLSADSIAELAHDYAHTSPAAIRLNYGMQRTRGGGNAVRAICCLPALTGAWRNPAGGLLMSSSSTVQFDKARLLRPDLIPGADRGHVPRTLNMSTLGQDLLKTEAKSRIDALIVYNSNPLAVAPQSAQVQQGLARPDLFTVVLEQFQTDTADYADYILPATTQLEHWDIHGSYGHTDILLNRPAIAAQGQCKPNSAIFRLLAQAMGYTDACFGDDDETLCQQALGLYPNAAAIWASLLEQGYYSPSAALNKTAPFADGGFATPSGKCEFYSARLAAQGLDGLPDYLPNYEIPHPQARYPLAMISPPARNFLNSSFVNVKSLRNMEGEPYLEIHPSDAASRAIAHGDTVRIYNDRGEYHCRAHVSSRARPQVVNGMGIWWRKLGLNKTNVNQLTHQGLTDLGQGPSFYDCCVEVERCDNSDYANIPHQSP